VVSVTATINQKIKKMSKRQNIKLQKNTQKKNKNQKNFFIYF